MALSANHILSPRAPTNHKATLKYQFDISSELFGLVYPIYSYFTIRVIIEFLDFYSMFGSLYKHSILRIGHILHCRHGTKVMEKANE